MDAQAQTLAEQVGKTMYAVDTATKDTMGITLEECAPGRATMRMEVKPLHLNGHQICHGGFIFTLADSTFAFACNSYNGDVLTCVGIEQTLSGRHGIYDMRVTNQHGDTIAMFRGKSAQIQGTVIPA
jgi:acyl-CoA thioesterase